MILSQILSIRMLKPAGDSLVEELTIAEHTCSMKGQGGGGGGTL